MSSLSVVLCDPKFPHNVGGAIRACSAFGVPELRWTGQRVLEALDEDGKRLPREERMKGYRDVRWYQQDRPFDEFPDTPVVGVELHETAMPLVFFEHPENAVYVFGPEDGSIPKAIRVLCHSFVVLPTHHCLNLSAAINCILLHRRIQRQVGGLEPIAMEDILHEARG